MEEERIYLAVPYAEKDEAKSLGATWDSGMKRWYCTSAEEELVAKYQMIHLSVPFDKKEEAKKLGAMWDASRKSWYCASSNTQLIQRFPLTTQGPAMTPNVNAFANFIAKPKPKAKPTGLKPPGSGGGWGQIKSFQWDQFED